MYFDRRKCRNGYNADHNAKSSHTISLRLWSGELSSVVYNLQYLLSKTFFFISEACTDLKWTTNPWVNICLSKPSFYMRIKNSLVSLPGRFVKALVFKHLIYCPIIGYRHYQFCFYSTIFDTYTWTSIKGVVSLFSSVWYPLITFCKNPFLECSNSPCAPSQTSPKQTTGMKKMTEVCVFFSTAP